jgi:hypothetical protein
MYCLITFLKSVNQVYKIRSVYLTSIDYQIVYAVDILLV